MKKILLCVYLGLIVDRSSLLDLALTSLKMLVLRMMRAVMVTRCSATFMLEEPWRGEDMLISVFLLCSDKTRLVRKETKSVSTKRYKDKQK